MTVYLAYVAPGIRDRQETGPPGGAAKEHSVASDVDVVGDSLASA